MLDSDDCHFLLLSALLAACAPPPRDGRGRLQPPAHPPESSEPPRAAEPPVKRAP